MDVKLEAYEGPLDLLLKLIQQHKIDIYDIPISTLTDSYLQEIANITPDMGQLSEFLVMAATLLEIKSRMLLPRPKMEAEGEAEDPREALVQKLLAYKQAQAIAQELKAIFPEGERVAGMGDLDILNKLRLDAKSTLPDLDISLVSASYLLDVFVDIMSRKEERRDTVRAGYGRMPRDRFTVTEKVLHIREILDKLGRISLRFLFSGCHSKSERVVTFLALLEMVRQGEIRATQPESFGDIEVLPCPA